MGKYLKVGLVLDDTLDKPDGVQAAVLDIGSELSKRGHDVHYLVTETSRTDIQNVHVMSQYYSMKFNGNSVRTPKPASKKKIKKLLKNLQLDVIHVQMPHSPFMSGRIISNAPENTKIFGTFHILPYDKKTVIGTKLLGLMVRENLKKCDGFFAVSPPAQEFMKSTYHVEPEVLSNPVDYAYYSQFKKNSRQDNKKNIVFVGRFDTRKGVRQLIEAFATLDENIRNSCRLTMCGKGPLLDEMKTLAVTMNVEVTFPGFVTDDEKAQYLANADIAVFPSTSGESFGIVLAEAMAAGAGVTLGGDNPGYRSVLSEFPDVLFDPDDIDEFSRVLTTFIQNDTLRLEIGSKQHSYVKLFDIDVIVDQLVKAYTR